MAQNQYVTVAQLATVYDTRLLGQLGSDTASTPVTVDENATIIVDALRIASAEVEARAARGGRYTPTDLLTLQAASDYMLRKLVCDLAVIHLHRRRAGGMPDSMKETREESMTLLGDLQDGTAVFPMSGSAIGAGQAGVRYQSGVSRARQHLVSDTRYFPRSRTQSS